MAQITTPEIISDLRTLLPSNNVLSAGDDLAVYGRDWVKHYDPRPSAIAFPTSTEEVVKLVRFARERKIALVPSGGRTGLSGGAVALNGEIVVSFEKMNKILDFNPVDRTVTCQAGVVTEDMQKYVRDRGFFYPVDFAARGSSHIGGNVATNAGGIKVIRYGLTRDWVAGLRVVTGSGEILDLNRGLVKNATGLDLRHLFIGSEGSLGFITEATLRFTSPPNPLTVLVLGVPSLDAIMNVFREFRDGLSLMAFEFFSDVALKHVVEHTHLAKPLSQDAPNYLLVEVEKTDAETESRILSTFEHCVEKCWIMDGVIGQSESQARDFWRLREDISEATAPYSPYKNDISVTISRVPDFLADVDAVLNANYPDFEVVWFGHIGDGNMHINILKPPAMQKDEFVKRCADASQLLFEVVKKHGGSISAEHGVGLVKKPYLSYSRSPEEIEMMKGIKRVFDPDGLLNPGKIFD